MSTSPAITVNSVADPRQDNDNWLQMWRDHQTDFHQLTVTPLLQHYWSSLLLKKDSRVLVPLCGKSLDMLWLAQQGFQVIGIELSPIAVSDFFREAKLKPQKRRTGKFTRWQSGAITIWCGDFFSLNQKQLGQIDMVYDRAALTALPESIRTLYINHLRQIIHSQTGIFLLTIEDIGSDGTLSPDIIDGEISRLFSPFFDIELLKAEPHAIIPDQSFQSHDKVYRLLAH